MNGKEFRSISAVFYYRHSTSLFMQCYAMCKIDVHDIRIFKNEEM